jgi:hypothetical protein
MSAARSFSHHDMSDEAKNPDDPAHIARWRMSEETLPQRPDDSEWHKALALRLLLPLGAPVTIVCAAFINPVVEQSSS